MRAIDRSPARFSSRTSAAVGFIAFLAGGLYSWYAMAVAATGLLLLGAGLVRGSQRLVTVGASGLFVGALVAGAFGAPPGAVLVGTTATVVAWDVGGNAVVVGAQLGREAETVRVEVVHTVASAVVGLVSAGFAFAIYRTATDGQPVAALVFLLVAALALTVTLSSNT